MTYGAKNYKQMQITTASPAQILILLYEGAIQNVKKAILAIEQKNMAEKGKWIGKAHDIINELTVSLNHEVAGQIAKDLERLYNFMVTQLLKANVENDREALLAVQKNLETLLEGWKGAVSQFQKDSAQPKKVT
ncbi:MAG: flagellar export chaperone FliS [Bdellovibrionales bacterium]|nr:flagellar export chaperone FliS [Bdellovibrionales bacterium]